MIAGKRLTDIDENGRHYTTPDFSGGDVVRAPRRRFAVVTGKRVVQKVEWSARDKRDIKVKALMDLKQLGYHNDTIAVAVSLTERRVRQILNEVAEDSERLQVAAHD